MKTSGVTDGFYGLPTRTVANDHLRLDVLAEAGPRIVRLFLAGLDENQLAETPDVKWETPSGEYCLQGGHRLWHSPEASPRSSIPDNSGLEIEEVEDGVLLTYLHNHYTANKAGEENTGHSAGDGIAPTNVNVQLGPRLAQELISEIDDGIYITAGGPHPDATTGDFSSTVDFGFKIENGEAAYPIRNAAIGGSFLELIQGIDEISSDYREEPGRKMPTIRLKSARLAGSG